MEKLKMKNVIHVLGVSGSGTTMARLCLSAFARVATDEVIAIRQSMVFATAHSRGLRPRRSGSGLPSRIFATAHSCGLRLLTAKQRRKRNLCHSAFVRVATPSAVNAVQVSLLCHSAFVRVATCRFCVLAHCYTLCHSAFVRVATQNKGGSL